MSFDNDFTEDRGKVTITGFYSLNYETTNNSTARTFPLKFSLAKELKVCFSVIGKGRWGSSGDPALEGM